MKHLLWKTQLAAYVIIIIFGALNCFQKKRTVRVTRVQSAVALIALDSIRLETIEMFGDSAAIFLQQMQLQSGLFLMWTAAIHPLV